VELLTPRLMTTSDVQAGPDAQAPLVDETQHAVRLALGAAVLAAERFRADVPNSDAFLVTVGLLQQTRTGARRLARRVMKPCVRYLDRLSRVMDDARQRGSATVAAGRMDAAALIDHLRVRPR